jgi:hypothetical protein
MPTTLTYQGPHTGVDFDNGGVHTTCMRGESCDVADELVADFVAGGDWVAGKPSKQKPDAVKAADTKDNA